MSIRIEKKKERSPEKIIQKALTSAFFRYHLNKMDTIEFVIRFLRIDMVKNGRTTEKENFLKAVRNYRRGIKEDCSESEKISVETKSLKHRIFKIPFKK